MLRESAQFCRDEIARTDALLRLAGAKGRSAFALPSARSCGRYRACTMTHTGSMRLHRELRDYDRTDTERIVSTVMNRDPPRGGGGLHDGGARASRPPPLWNS
jgi:hypothetical protein